MHNIDPESLAFDKRVILTLDAGGTKLAFSAYSGMKECITPFRIPSAPADAAQYIGNIESGFMRALSEAGGKADAISFGFPGPADYGDGIIGDLPNLSGFRGGIALGPFLARRFGIPVYINNDGNLFALGEWAFGFLPWVNERLRESGSKRRFRNLVGLTIGTGFGCGIVIDGNMVTGDNYAGGEIWHMRNKLAPDTDVEEAVGRHGIKKVFARLSGTGLDEAPEADVIEDIARGKAAGDVHSALEAFARLGEAAGDAAASALALVDGLLVIGGGIANAANLFMPAFMSELGSSIEHVSGEDVPRIDASPYFLDDPLELAAFLKADARELRIPETEETVSYDAKKRLGVGISKLGTGSAIALGAYIYAIGRLDEQLRIDAET